MTNEFIHQIGETFEKKAKFNLDSMSKEEAINILHLIYHELFKSHITAMNIHKINLEDKDIGFSIDRTDDTLAMYVYYFSPKKDRKSILKK